MRTLPLALRLEKNKLIATEPWLVLLDLTLPTGDHIRLVANTEDISFGGHTYTAFAFKMGEVKESGDGRVVGVTLQIANQQRAFNQFVDLYAGLVGCEVSLMVVHAGNLGEDYTELTLTWNIMSSTVAEDWITFNLGAENPMRRRFPLFNALPETCPWMFKSAECAYTGAETTCNRSLSRCTALSNTARFGGRPGIRGATRFVA